MKFEFLKCFENLKKLYLVRKNNINMILIISIIAWLNSINLIHELFIYILLAILIILLVLKKINDIDLIIYSLSFPNEIFAFIGIGIAITNIIIKILRKDIDIENIKKSIRYDKTLMVLISLILLSTLISFISTKVILNGLIYICYLGVMLFIFKIIKFNQYGFKDFINSINNIFFIQVIVFFLTFISELVSNWGITPGDKYKGTFSNAHIFCFWLIIYLILLIIRKNYLNEVYSRKRRIIEVTLVLFMIYMSDGKHLWLSFLLAIITYKLFNKVKIFKTRLILVTSLFIVFSLFIVTNIVKINSVKKFIYDKSSYATLYIYKEPFNTKYKYFDSTLNKKLKGYSFLIGFGPGQYGSRVANLRAYDSMYKADGLAKKLSKIISPYELQEYKEEAERYDKEFIDFIPYMSAVLAYPFSSIIAIIAELGILGFLAYMIFLNNIAVKSKFKEINLVIILFIYLMIFDSYLEMTSVVGLLWILMGVSQNETV